MITPGRPRRPLDAPGGPERRGTLRRGRLRRAAPILLALVLAAALVGCAPSALAPRPGTTTPSAADPAERDLQRTAAIVYHRMALGFLETGRYTTNVLVDVSLPQGVRWTLVDYPEDGSGYTLELTSDALPARAYRVSPDGVRAVTRR